MAREVGLGFFGHPVIGAKYVEDARVRSWLDGGGKPEGWRNEPRPRPKLKGQDDVSRAASLARIRAADVRKGERALAQMELDGVLSQVKLRRPDLVDRAARRPRRGESW